MFAHIQRLHLGFHDTAQTGQLMSRATTDLHRPKPGAAGATAGRWCRLDRRGRPGEPLRSGVDLGPPSGSAGSLAQR